MWFTSKKLFSSILAGKNFLLAEVVLGIACFELLAFEICSCLFAVMQCASRNVLYFSIHVSRAVMLSSVLFLMEGQTYLRNWFKAIDLIDRN